jgi:CRISPR-associated endonuclease/helicase Cas3
VLVPYGEEGESLIENIRKEYNLYNLKKLLRKSQQYSVNISHHTKNVLGDDAIEILHENVLALKVGYYDNEIGIIIPFCQIGSYMAK